MLVSGGSEYGRTVHKTLFAAATLPRHVGTDAAESREITGADGRPRQAQPDGRRVAACGLLQGPTGEASADGCSACRGQGARAAACGEDRRSAVTYGPLSSPVWVPVAARCCWKTRAR